MLRKKNIAIIGLGNIGSYLYNFLQKNKQLLTKKNNCVPNVVYVSARKRNKKRGLHINKEMVKKLLRRY